MNNDRFIWFSDLHVHPHGEDWRRVDFAVSILDWVAEEAKKRGIQTIVFGGDLFQKRDRIFSICFNKTYSKLKEIKEQGFNMYYLVGNHDMPMKNSTDYHALMALAPFVTIVDDVRILKGENFDFYMIPYVENLLQLQWAITEMEKRQDKSRKNVLLAHLDIQDAWYNSKTKVEHGLEPNSLGDSWDLVLTGHFHNFQRVGYKKNIWYSGTPLEINFGDEGLQKGILAFDNGEIEFIENTFSPRHITITENEIDERVTGNYVKLIYESAETLTESRELIEQYEPLDVEPELRPLRALSENEMPALENPKEVENLIGQWVEKNKETSPELDSAKLLKIGQSIIGLAQEDSK